MKSTKAVHQQYVNCLINNGGLPVKTWLLIACDAAFYAIMQIILLLKRGNETRQLEVYSRLLNQKSHRKIYSNPSVAPVSSLRDCAVHFFHAHRIMISEILPWDRNPYLTHVILPRLCIGCIKTHTHGRQVTSWVC